MTASTDQPAPPASRLIVILAALVVAVALVAVIALFVPLLVGSDSAADPTGAVETVDAPAEDVTDDVTPAGGEQAADPATTDTESADADPADDEADTSTGDEAVAATDDSNTDSGQSGNDSGDTAGSSDNGATAIPIGPNLRCWVEGPATNPEVAVLFDLAGAGSIAGAASPVDGLVRVIDNGQVNIAYLRATVVDDGRYDVIVSPVQSSRGSESILLDLAPTDTVWTMGPGITTGNNVELSPVDCNDIAPVAQELIAWWATE